MKVDELINEESSCFAVSLQKEENHFDYVSILGVISTSVQYKSHRSSFILFSFLYLELSQTFVVKLFKMQESCKIFIELHSSTDNQLLLSHELFQYNVENSQFLNSNRCHLMITHFDINFHSNIGTFVTAWNDGLIRTFELELDFIFERFNCLSYLKASIHIGLPHISNDILYLKFAEESYCWVVTKSGLIYQLIDNKLVLKFDFHGAIYLASSTFSHVVISNYTHLNVIQFYDSIVNIGYIQLDEQLLGIACRKFGYFVIIYGVTLNQLLKWNWELSARYHEQNIVMQFSKNCYSPLFNDNIYSLTFLSNELILSSSTWSAGLKVCFYL